MSHHRYSTPNFVAVSAAVCIAAGLSPAASRADLKDTVTFDIAAQQLPLALNRYSRQAGVQVTSRGELIEGKTSTTVTGKLAAREALNLLLKDTDLRFEVIDEKTVVIMPRTATAPAREAERQSASRDLAQIQLANADTSQANAAAGSGTEDSGRKTSAVPSADKGGPSQEMVVTGSHLRGAEASGSKVSVYTAEDIERSGYATVQQFLERLPQNFGGGHSDEAINVAGATGFSPFGSGVNLRGLGNAATLVLLNGQRLAPAGYGDFVDVGVIPASAVERVEVLTDGASAIYGSDAIGGVVNFIMREDFAGADTRLRFATVTQGSSNEYRATQGLGHRWSSGSVLASYEYYRRQPLETEQRSATRISPDPTYLFPGERRHSALLHLSQRLGERSQLLADGQFAQRDGDYRYFDDQFGLGIVAYELEQSQVGGRLGFITDLSGGWQGEAFLSHNRSKSVSNLTYTGVFEPGDTVARVLALDLKADGRVFNLPGGAAQAAFGGQLRRENFDYAVTNISQERDTRSVFGELNLPFVSGLNERRGVRRLAATAAVRHDRYDDFGTTTNPKFGLSWSPLEGVDVRGTYGTAFRAPQLYDMAARRTQLVIGNRAEANGSQTMSVRIIGPSVDLKPETARSWTAGIDFAPAWIPRMKVGLTYYSIEYDDRIEIPSRDVRASQALRYESIFAPLITRNPSSTQIADLLATPNALIVNGSGLPIGSVPGAVRAIIDLRKRNLSGTTTDGLDLGVNYRFGYGANRFGLSLDGTYILNLAYRITDLAPWEQRFDAIAAPANFKGRGGITWARGMASGALFLNHTSGFVNDLVTPREPVRSWTTADLNFRYEFESRGTMLDGFTVGLSAVNLTGEAPPFVTENSLISVNFDATNADALGRFIALEISRKW